MNERNVIFKGLHIDELKTKIYSYQRQEEIHNRWLKKRFEEVLPRAMRQSGIDLWIVACREYNEDPVFNSLVPKAMITARRTTILVFHDDGNQVHRYALTRPGVGLDDYYTAVWTNPKGSIWAKSSEDAKGIEPETQLECLGRIIHQCNPKKIGLNFSKNFAFGDGLSHHLYDSIMSVLTAEDKSKVVSADEVCVGWLETRIEEEKAAYTGIMQIAHALIDEAFSSRVILPGVTTNDDVKYFMMQKTIDLGLTPWFDFEVSIRRNGVGAIYDCDIIMPGDLLHCDVGLKYLGLCTDTQENCYVLKKGEQVAPQGLLDAFKAFNDFEEIVVSNFVEGKSGNQILKDSLEMAKANGLKPCLYTHPIGYHGHGAGPTIGLYDQQAGVVGTGDYTLHNDTFYSLELNVLCTIPEWGNMEMAFCGETDISFENNKVYYVAGRQTEFHYVQ